MHIFAPNCCFYTLSTCETYIWLTGNLNMYSDSENSPHITVFDGTSIQCPAYGSIATAVYVWVLIKRLTIIFSPLRYHSWFPITENGSLFSHQSCLAVRCEFEGGWFINKRTHRFWITVMFCAAQNIDNEAYVHTYNLHLYIPDTFKVQSSNVLYVTTG